MVNRYSGFSKCASCHLIICLLLIHLTALSLKTNSSEDNLISRITPLDKKYMQLQKSIIEDIARSTGQSFNGNVDHDLAVLQRLLDSRTIKNDMKSELQAMGFIMGDLLATELGMHWIVYRDHIGRSRALRYKNSSNFLFPVTMISRRREVNNLTSVADIYQKALTAITPFLDPLPFQ